MSNHDAKIVKEIDDKTWSFILFVEERLIGCILLSACYVDGGVLEYQDDIDECTKLVKEHHFISEYHRIIYKAILKCDQPDILGVYKQLLIDNARNMNMLQFLDYLHNQTPSPFDLMHYAREVVFQWECRTGKTNTLKGDII